MLRAVASSDGGVRNESIFANLVNLPSINSTIRPPEFIESPVLSSPGFLCLSAVGEFLTKVHFELYPQLIVVRPAEFKSHIGCIPVDFCQMNAETHAVCNNKVVHKIQLSCKKVNNRICFENLDMFEKWKEALGRYTVQHRVEEEYRMKEVIGKGTFGVVIKGECKKTGGEVAIKKYKKQDFAENNEVKRSILTEARILGTVDHKNTIKLKALYEDDSNLYIVTDLCEGADLLLKIVVEGSLRPVVALKYMRSILSILAHLERKKIVHRDLKPQNVLLWSLEDASDVCLIDYGFACKVEDCMSMFPRAGTKGYIAPEIAKGEAYGCKADVYSAGIILYLMLCGDIPAGSSIVVGNDPALSRMPKNIISLLSQMIETNQGARITASEALKHEAFLLLENVMEEDDRTRSPSDSLATLRLKEAVATLKWNHNRSTI